MATELEFVNYKQFVENLPEISDFSSGDSAVVSNNSAGPRKMPKDDLSSNVAAKTISGNLSNVIEKRVYNAGEKFVFGDRLFIVIEEFDASNGIDYSCCRYYSLSIVDDLVKKIRSAVVNETESSATRNIYPEITWTNGYMAKDGRKYPSESLKYSTPIAVSEGDVLTYFNQNYTFRYVTAFDYRGNAITASGVESQNSYTVPSGVSYVVLTAYISYGTMAINMAYTEESYENNLKDDVVELKAYNDSFDDAVVVEENVDVQKMSGIFNDITWTSGYMDKAGTIAPSTSLRYSNKIPVSEGDILEYSNSNYSFRFLTAFTDNTAVSDAGSNSELKYYVVPAGINYVVISTYTSYGTNEIYKTEVELNKNVGNIKKSTVGKITKEGDLSDGDVLDIPNICVKNGNVFSFSANVTSFSSIKFSRGVLQIVVNATSIVIGSTTIPHGLTIGHNISLLIEQTDFTEYFKKIVLSSDGAVFTYTTPVSMNYTGGRSLLTSVGSTLTDARFSWTSKNIFSPVWVFGDSYISFYDTRWPYYAAQDGFDKDFFVGYAGENSAFAFWSLVILLQQVTKPKVVAWCLGMNDPDTSNAVNASWKFYFDRVVELSKQYDFELVLYTVPTTPTMENGFKNAVVRSSGFRYIEADKAVRIDDDGSWIPGALDVDNVHPTALGAKILYYRVVADFPEIAAN